jgi:hypothetical protein
MREERHEYDIPKVSQLSIFVGIRLLTHSIECDIH